MSNTAEVTLTLPLETLHYIQQRIADGIVQSPSKYVENLIVGDMLGPIPSTDSLSHWSDTEGTRRLVALHADPSCGLTLDQAFAGLLGEHDQEKQAG